AYSRCSATSVLLAVLCSVLRYLLFSFFLLLLPLPRSTLFPYTTLFRSKIIKITSKFFIILNICSFKKFSFFINIRMMTHFIFFKDRKSTRLNSSHVASSYAVFSLKKKNWVFFVLAACLESPLYIVRLEP